MFTYIRHALSGLATDRTMQLYFNPRLDCCDISGRISLTILIPRLLVIFSDPKRLEICGRDTWETGCNNLEIYYINKHWPCQLNMHARVWNRDCSHENREIEHFLRSRLLLCNQTDIFTSFRCLCLVGNSLLIGRHSRRLFPSLLLRWFKPDNN